MEAEIVKTSNFLNINGWQIWYDKYGTGRDIMLFIPGAIGTGESDFKEQLRGPNAFDLNKYTIITVDLAGWGRSRPPKRPFGPKIYEFDADCCLKLMEILGYNSYSIIGWSEGSKVACHMAMKRPANITSLTLIAFFIYVSDKSLAPILSTRNIEKLTQFYNNLLPVYGDSVNVMWNEFLNFLTFCPKYFPDGFWSKDLGKIMCPVLIVHGDRDFIASVDHPLYGKQQIPDCRLRRYEDGSHNVHQTHAAEFKTIVEQFLADCDDF